MNFKDRLQKVADRYRNLGFEVTLDPTPADLPDFAKDFKVQILATKSDQNVLTVAKDSPSELEADTEVERYARTMENRPGWKLDVFVLGPDAPSMPTEQDAREPDEAEIRRALEQAEQLLRDGHRSPAFVMAWAALESAMRRKLVAEGSRAGYGTSPRTMLNELFSAGAFSNRSFRNLEGMFQLRNLIVHGFDVPPFPPTAVQSLAVTARTLLEAPPQVKQTA